MKVIDSKNLHKDRVVKCPNGGFVSNRMLIESDQLGFAMTRTVIPKGEPQHWHYKNHLEACYCVSGSATLIDCNTFDEHEIKPGMLYALDTHDEHIFHAHEDCELICVFNPPLKGREVHGEDGSYE